MTRSTLACQAASAALRTQTHTWSTTEAGASEVNNRLLLDKPATSMMCGHSVIARKYARSRIIPIMPAINVNVRVKSKLHSPKYMATNANSTPHLPLVPYMYACLSFRNLPPDRFRRVVIWRDRSTTHRMEQEILQPVDEKTHRCAIPQSKYRVLVYHGLFRGQD